MHLINKSCVNYTYFIALDGIVTWVDDTKQTDGKIPAGGYSALVTDGEVGSWKSSRPSKNAPFDQYVRFMIIS